MTLLNKPYWRALSENSDTAIHGKGSLVMANAIRGEEILLEVVIVKSKH